MTFSFYIIIVWAVHLLACIDKYFKPIALRMSKTQKVLAILSAKGLRSSSWWKGIHLQENYSVSDVFASLVSSGYTKWQEFDPLVSQFSSFWEDAFLRRLGKHRANRVLFKLYALLKMTKMSLRCICWCKMIYSSWAFCSRTRNNLLSILYLTGESMANANGPTPVPSPPGSPKKLSRSSSPQALVDRQGRTSTHKPSL